MLVQNGALRGEANCDEHCTVVVAIRLRPVAVTWACLLGSGGVVVIEANCTKSPGKRPGKRLGSAREAPLLCGKRPLCCRISP